VEDIINQSIPVKLAKDAIRRSLSASTVDGVFAAIYSNIIGGVLLTNFLMDLGASATQIGLLSAVPLVANLLQPLGAYFSEKVSSRHWYCLWIYAPSRVLWVGLCVGIVLLQPWHLDPQFLIEVTLAIALLSHGIGALGSAAWLSWLAMLVPRRLRGRYFGLRNSAANLTSLIAVPLAGMAVSAWGGGSIQGYGLVLLAGITLGIVSLMFQGFMSDINPQQQQILNVPEFNPIKSTESVAESQTGASREPSLWQDRNFLLFSFYFSLWMFAVNLSAPFFNLYMLNEQDLNLDISQVTLYNSIMTGANLVLLMVWGRLADRFGNRPLLFFAGLVVALTPLLWLLAGQDSLSVWVGLPLLHILMGGSGAAIDLCSNNLQIGVAPVHRQSTYFGTIAALSGVSGALGTSLGGLLVERWAMGGLLGLFIISSICRLVALVPLLFVHEQRSVSLRQLVQTFISSQDTEQLSSGKSLPLEKQI
jgi:MFS family permease